jgi:hypothetical protein
LTFFGTAEVVPFQNERSVAAANQGAKRMFQNRCADFVRRLITKIAIGVPGIESSDLAVIRPESQKVVEPKLPLRSSCCSGNFATENSEVLRVSD